jgi:hypothetical protein
MFLLRWYKEYLEVKEQKVCSSCETLRQQLEISNYEKKQLLNRILEKPEPIAEKEPPEITRPRSIPWNLRKQIMEREDREKARAMKEAAKPDSAITVEELEKEMKVAEAIREADSVVVK